MTFVANELGLLHMLGRFLIFSFFKDENWGFMGKRVFSRLSKMGGIFRWKLELPLLVSSDSFFYCGVGWFYVSIEKEGGKFFPTKKNGGKYWGPFKSRHGGSKRDLASLCRSKPPEGAVLGEK